MTEATNVPSNPECDSAENTLVENLRHFSQVLISAGRKESTVKMYNNYITGASKAVDGKDPVLWTDADIKAFMLSDVYHGWKASTQRTVRAALKSYWEVHGKGELLPPNHYFFWRDRNVYSGGSNRYDELKAKAPSAEEVQTVLDICCDVILTSRSDAEIYRHMAVYFIAAYGLRRIEVANLRECDVRMEDKTLHIEESKGDKSRDVYMDIPLDKEMWDRFMVARSSIIDLLRSNVADGHVVAKLDSLSDRAASLFFVRENGDTGEPVPPDGLGKMMGRQASRILGRSVNPHAFRHAKAFYLLEVAHLPLHNAADYLGHTNIQMTADYSYTSVKEQREAFKNGNGGPAPAPEPAPSPAPSGKLDAAVAALTSAYSRGDLSADAFAAAVAALSSGN
jgi:integrase